MAKYLMVNPNNEEFKSLMERIAEAIRTGDEKMTAEVKADFAEYDTLIYYNSERDEVRVVVKDSPYVDFPVSRFTTLEYKKK
jgi:transcription elongation GreA/GreB family factor